MPIDAQKPISENSLISEITSAIKASATSTGLSDGTNNAKSDPFPPLCFLGLFLWASKSGQFDDDYTPSVRILFDDEVKKLTKLKETEEKQEQSFASLKGDILYDETQEQAGAKFTRGELLGIPTQIIVSKKTLETNCVEVQNRSTGEKTLVSIDDLLKYGI